MPDEKSTPDPATSQWIQTFTGLQFWPLDPRPEHVSIVDIAHALGMKCRFTGHTRAFYSVAQHCVLMARQAAPELRRWALLHDAGEAYLPDVAKPLKPHLAGFHEIETRVMRAVSEALRLPWPEPQGIKLLDLKMLATERRDLMALQPAEWVDLERVEPFEEVILPWGPGMAEDLFMREFAR